MLRCIWRSAALLSLLLSCSVNGLKLARNGIGQTDASRRSLVRELKDKVRKQQLKIAALENELAGRRKKTPSIPSSSSSSSAAHGGGASSAEELQAYLTSPFYRLAVRRVGWLAVFLVSLSFTAVIMNGFEHTLARQIELAYFVPLLAGHGGNTGGQAVGTVLSALSAGRVSVRDAPRVIRKESLAGLTAGAWLGLVCGPVIRYGMGISPHVSAVMTCTIPLVSLIAAGIGSAVPFLCLAIGLDPSVIAGPAMTSFVDVGGLLAYFLVAKQIFMLYNIQL